MAKQNAEELLSALQAEDGGLKMIVNTMPGGVINCRYDEALTLVYMSDMFLHMIGYTRDQLRDEKGNSLKALIPQEEQASLMEEVKRQLALSDTKEIQYRLRCRDGSSIWVLDKGHLVRDSQGNQSFCCILVDITERIGIERELQLSLQRHQIVLEQTNDIIFEWTCATRELIMSPAWAKTFGPAPNIDLMYAPSHNAEKDRIHPDDLNALYAFPQALDQKVRSHSMKLRVRDVGGQFRWCKVRLSIQFADDGRAIKYLGVIRDIDDEMRNTQALLQKVQRDYLTGLYNRETTRELIEQRLKERPDETHAMLMIDLDDFKKLNDSKGHLYGDAALRAFGTKLKSFFYKDDILGRYGGDEFLVFLSNAHSRENVLKIVKSFLRVTQKGNLFTEMKDSPSISAGIAVYPEQAATYDQLFREADIALYQAKQAGKNTCVLYHSADFPILSITREESYAMRTQRRFQDDFEMLYNAADTEKAVRGFLAAVGQEYNVSRAYVFELNEDGRLLSNTIEWCGEGVPPAIDSLQNMPVEQYDHYFKNFDESGVFYCRDLKYLPLSQQQVFDRQNIQSVLQCTMTEKGQIWGFIGFDECRNQRFWEPVQIQALTHCARIISVFLKKSRLEQKLEQMEGQRSFIREK